ncbi:hypothetical protein RP20_CCG017884 [Aedes albopictus]|nr:hypothetical protein RP20_CCG017884 [Aedes albopictus]
MDPCYLQQKEEKETDQCLYKRKTAGGVTEFILIYVDDMIIVTTTEQEFESIYNQLEKNFAVTNLGDVRSFLGIEVEKDDDGYKLNQQAYIRKLTERFHLQDAKPSKIPMDPCYLQQKEEKEPLSNNSQYLSLIGGLLYIAVQTRPDVSLSVSLLAQKSSSPSQQDWNEAKKVLRYLYATRDHKLKLGMSREQLCMYVDADYAGDCRDRKSNSGYLIKYGGGVIAWGSRKQTSVALSSTEAEFISLAEGCQELSWTKRLLEEIAEEDTGPIIVFEDNQSCIKLVEGDRIERRSKHIDVRYFFVRDLQQKEVIKLEYCLLLLLLSVRADGDHINSSMYRASQLDYMPCFSVFHDSRYMCS